MHHALLPRRRDVKVRELRDMKIRSIQSKCGVGSRFATPEMDLPEEIDVSTSRIVYDIRSRSEERIWPLGETSLLELVSNPAPVEGGARAVVAPGRKWHRFSIALETGRALL